MSHHQNTSRARQKPRIYDWSYLVLADLKKQLCIFAEQHVNVKNGYALADIGCGLAPYQVYFRNYAQYLRIDNFASPAIDVVSHIEDLKLADETVDFVICTQVLEHTDDFYRAVAELHRVLKKDGRAFISLPFAAHIHGTDDRWRFSLHTIKQLFKDFKILHLKDSGGTLISWGQYFNTFLASFPLLRYIGIPAFILINVGVPILDRLLQVILRLVQYLLPKEARAQFIFNVNHSLPLNYSVIVQK